MIPEGEDFLIEFDDKVGEGLSKENREAMEKEMTEIANKYGYDFQSSGSSSGYKKMLASRFVKNLTDTISATLFKP
jgi:hypothetical protein